jgi:hypothetical protein
MLQFQIGSLVEGQKQVLFALFGFTCSAVVVVYAHAAHCLAVCR